MGRSVRGFVARSHRRMEGDKDDDGNQFLGLWCDLTLPGGDEDGDLIGTISNLTARSRTLSVCTSVRPFSFSSLFAHLRK